MDPLQFLDTCSRLYGLGTRPEADDRTILSRLYYAFFLTLLEGIATRDSGFAASVTRTGADHRLVRDYLKGDRFTVGRVRRAGVGSRVGWYERYDALFIWREKADYDMSVSAMELATRADDLMADTKGLRPLVESFAPRNTSS